MYSYFKNAREPMSSYTHFLGVIFAVVGTVFLFVLNNLTGNFSARMFVSILAFGGSMLALYSASSIYHYYNGPVLKQEYLRKLDHAMIYVLIAGSYTPICLKFMEGAPRNPLCPGHLGSSVVWYLRQNVLDERSSRNVHRILPADGLGNHLRLESTEPDACRRHRSAAGRRHCLFHRCCFLYFKEAKHLRPFRIP